MWTQAIVTRLFDNQLKVATLSAADMSSLRFHFELISSQVAKFCETVVGHRSSHHAQRPPPAMHLIRLDERYMAEIARVIQGYESTWQQFDVVMNEAIAAFI